MAKGGLCSSSRKLCGKRVTHVFLVQSLLRQSQLRRRRHLSSDPWMVSVGFLAVLRWFACINSFLFLARTGLLLLLRHALRVKPDGLASAGLPCTSFVWVNRGTHQRSETNPRGNSSLPYVAAANKILDWTMWLSEL